MKKILLALLVAVLAVCTLFAFTSCGGDDATYELSEDGTYYVLTKYTLKKADMEIVIPEEYEGKPVKKIDDAFFAYNDTASIKKLVIPASVTMFGENGIGELCWYGIENYTVDIYYGGSEQTWFENYKDGHIYNYNLYINDTLVTSPTIPATMTEIPENYAEGCISLTEIIIPETVTKIGRAAFDSCKGVKTLTIPKTVTAIEEYAFASLHGLTTLNYNPVNAVIGDADDNRRDDNGSVFYAMGTATETGVTIYINESVEVIPDFLFKSSSSSGYAGPNVKNVIIANGCNFKKVGYAPFANMVGENSEFTTENELTYIGSEENPYMFCGGTANLAITEIKINENCLYILDASFYQCDKVESVTIPASVLQIGSQAFYGVDVEFESASGWKIIGTNQAANLDYVAVGYTKPEYSNGITKLSTTTN